MRSRQCWSVERTPIVVALNVIASPEKNFFEAPTEGEGATCKSCGRCPWMHLNTFDKLMNVINQNNEIYLDEKTVAHAKKSINRMIEFEDKYYQKNKRAS